MTANAYRNSPVVSIAGCEVRQITYKGEPVVTFDMVDQVHQRPEGTAKDTFARNRKRFVKSEDYTKVSRKVWPTDIDWPFGAQAPVGTLLTRRGYLKLVKPMSDDRAWQVQGEMIDRYFMIEKIAEALPADVMEIIRRTDGIARMLSHKVTEIEKAVPMIVGQAVEAAIAADPRRAVLDYVSVRQLLDEAKAERKGRNCVNRRLGHAMRTRALLEGVAGQLRRCPHSVVWLFPRGFAAQCMHDFGHGMVREHNDAVIGQARLHLVKGQAA